MYLPLSNGIFIIYEDGRSPLDMFVNSCTMGCGTIYNDQAYHSIFPDTLLNQGLEICHLDAPNCVVALRLWVVHLKDRIV